MNILKIGSRGTDVKTLQQKLNLSVDGIFGPVTEEAVRSFQKAKGVTADGVVGPNTWSLLNANTQPQRMINKIIIHCAATPEGKDYTVEQIRQWHLARGFSDIGYHYVIYRDGSVHIGRSENVIGAHCSGYNANSIGVCYIGGEVADGSHIPKDTRTPAQKQALIKLLKSLKQKYSQATIHGHRDFANKACPSFDATNEYKLI